MSILTYNNQAIKAVQCRAGRALINWSQSDLGNAANVTKKTVENFERGQRQPHPKNIEAIRAALENAGVLFVFGEKGSLGVLLKPP